VDEAERNEPDLDIPAELTRRQDRLAVIAAAKARLEKRQRESDEARGRSEDDDRKPGHPNGGSKGGRRYQRDFGVPEDSAQENFTDSDSRIMKCAGGAFEQAFNAHAAVDETAQIVVAAELTNMASDGHRLPAILAAVKENLKALPERVVADAGFRSEDVFEQLKSTPIDLIVALGRDGKEISIDASRYPRTAEMAAKLRSDEGKSAYRKRKWISEAPNGWIKHVLGFRQFSFRGLTKVASEWKLICAALNLRRMSTLQYA
jgi:hypothetical protein